MLWGSQFRLKLCFGLNDARGKSVSAVNFASALSKALEKSVFYDTSLINSTPLFESALKGGSTYYSKLACYKHCFRFGDRELVIQLLIHDEKEEDRRDLIAFTDSS